MRIQICSQVNYRKNSALCVTRKAELAHRTKLTGFFQGALAGFRGAGLLASHRTAKVFKGNRPSIVLRIRRPSVVLTIEATGPLWLEGVWVTSRDGGLS